jgi:hypothetical protein
MKSITRTSTAQVSLVPVTPRKRLLGEGHKNSLEVFAPAARPRWPEAGIIEVRNLAIQKIRNDFV